jgi:hypothetical protein
MGGHLGFMNKSYAFGFLIVLLVIVLGLYVALTSFMSSRDALRAQSASSSSSMEAQATSTPARPAPTPTETVFAIPTSMPGITTTLTAMAVSVVTESPPPTEPPLPATTEALPTEPPAPQPTDTAAPVPQPPTPVPAPAYQFRLAGPPAPDPNYQICCYIFGTVRDATGNGIEGVQMQAFNEWNTLPAAITKGGGEAGQYNIPIGRDLVAWYIMVVDVGGNQISSQVQIQFDPNLANGYRVDWQRAY